MALSDVLSQVRLQMANIVSSDPPLTIPKSLGNRLTFIVWGLPNTSTPYAHSGRSGRPVVIAVDDIVVELHRLSARDEVNAAYDEVLAVFDTTLFALWTDFSESRWANTIQELRSVNTETFGPLDYGEKTTFGFRIVCTVAHAIELT